MSKNRHYGVRVTPERGEVYWAVLSCVKDNNGAFSSVPDHSRHIAERVALRLNDTGLDVDTRRHRESRKIKSALVVELQMLEAPNE